MTRDGNHSSMLLSLYVTETSPSGRRRRSRACSSACSRLPNNQQTDGKCAAAAAALLLFTTEPTHTHTHTHSIATLCLHVGPSTNTHKHTVNTIQFHLRSDDAAWLKRLIVKSRKMKKHSETTQTLRAGCSKADPQTNKHTHTHRQGRLQYTEQLSAQCKK